MKLNKIREELYTSKYNFLRENLHLNQNIILLGLGGSHAYGMERKDSDLDIRGIALNNKREILLNKDFEQIMDVKTDTTVFSFNKTMELLSKSNPNLIELLGLKPEHYLYLSEIGMELLKNKKMFLSKSCIQSFTGFAQSQIKRMEDKANLQYGKKVIGLSGKSGKHMAHAIRLYMMCIDILEKEEIITYREKEHEILMKIRNGAYLDDNNQPFPEFYELLRDYKVRLEYAQNNTSLPDKPDYKKIEDFKYDINEKIVKEN